MTEPAVIEVVGVTKGYPTGFWRRRREVLADLSFSVGRNEIVGFLGPNGAGKTTTIKILNRLAFHDAGSVRIFGEEVGRSAGIRRRIGFMPEHPYFYEYLTGGEFLAYCGHLSGMPSRDIGRRSAEMLGRVGLDGAADRSIRKYSKGMMQRLGLAQALLHDPELVILDEPMSGLDPMGRMEVRNLIRGLRAAGKTVFFSTHIISDVEALCDRVVMISGGRKVAEGVVEDLVGREVQSVEVVFAPCPPADRLAAAGIPAGAGSVEGHTFVLRVQTPEEANAWIPRFGAMGAAVQSFTPVRRRLEDIYVERLGAAAGGEGAPRD